VRRPKIIPVSVGDRILVGIALLNLLLAATPFVLSINYKLALWNALAGLFCGVLAYVFQDPPKETKSASDYAAVIASITDIGARLTDLNSFLRREQTRIEETEATVKKLNEEKIKLEPLVATQRDTVEAILRAHAERTAKNIWKERILGFALGATASLIASFIYDYIKHMT
jgi:septal ring factor EnvC (AmiA/AmiB activator)